MRSPPAVQVACRQRPARRRAAPAANATAPAAGTAPRAGCERRHRLARTLSSSGSRERRRRGPRVAGSYGGERSGRGSVGELTAVSGEGSARTRSAARHRRPLGLREDARDEPSGLVVAARSAPPARPASRGEGQPRPARPSSAGGGRATRRSGRRTLVAARHQRFGKGCALTRCVGALVLARRQRVTRGLLELSPCASQSAGLAELQQRHCSGRRHCAAKRSAGLRAPGCACASHLAALCRRPAAVSRA